MKAIIMAAGEGSRLRPLTDTTPKPLIKILGKPLITYTLELLYPHIEECIIVVKYKKEIFPQELWDSYKGMKLTYHEQGDEAGTGAALKDIWGVDDEVVIIAGDQIFFEEDMQPFLASPHFWVLATQVETPEKYGIFSLNEDGNLKEVVEKPTESIGNLANISCYKLPAEIFSILQSTPVSQRGEIEITDALNTLAQKYPIYVQEADFIDIWYCWNLLDANEQLLSKLQNSQIDGKIEDGVIIEGNIILEAWAQIKAGTRIEGNCYFGKDTLIWPNAYVRGNTSLWDGGKIGFSVEVKNSYIWEGTKISHLSYFWDSVLGNHINIGCGTKVANLRHDDANIRVPVKWELIDTGRRKFGCIIWNEVHTGIDTLIYPWRVIETGGATLPGDIVK